MPTAWVTPRLFVGKPPPWAHVRVTTAEDAVTAIDSGTTAVLPEGAWTAAREVLVRVGATEEWADFAVRRAQK
jgi:hypothetical protein